MSLLRKFIHDVVRSSPEARPAPKDGSPVDAGAAPSSGGLIDPFAQDETSEEPDGAETPESETPESGGLIDPFAQDEPEGSEATEPGREGAASTAPAGDAEAQAKQFFEEAEALYQKKQYADAAEKYQSAYQLAGADQRGSLAFNIAQSLRRAKSFPYAAAWYEKALALGGSGVSANRATIEELLAEVRGEMKKNPEKGPDGEDVGEAKMLFQQAEIAYAERDYAKAEPLYKQAYSRSNQSAIMFNIGQCCRKQGKHADAKYWYRTYLDKVPDSPHKAVVEELLAELKQKVPDAPKEGDEASQDDAKEKFEHAERLYKSQIYDQAADLYVEVFYDPAVAFARGEMAYNLGQCMRKSGNAASAIEWYRKALEYLPADHAYRTDIADRITELTGTKAALP
jgi:tetratricopeptide (TPR) repeat protein